MLSRICIVGNVDDGKSTLVGRLLMATQSVRVNEIQSLKDSGRFDLAHFTDGLKCEQEGDFTLDVAYRHLRIHDQRILLADAPGHVDKFQSTLTAISQSESVVIISDVERPLSPLVLLLAEAIRIFGIKECLVAVTKMDRIGYREELFRKREQELQALFQSVGTRVPTVIPVSAVDDQNIAFQSERMRWFVGPSLTRELARLGQKPARPAEDKLISGWILRQDSELKNLVLVRLYEGSMKVHDSLYFYGSEGSMAAKVLELKLGTAAFAEVVGPISVWVTLDKPIQEKACFSRISHFGDSKSSWFLARIICEGNIEFLKALVAQGSLRLENSWLGETLKMESLAFRSIDFLKDSGGNTGSALSIVESKFQLQGPALATRSLLGVNLVDRVQRRVVGSGALSPLP